MKLLSSLFLLLSLSLLATLFIFPPVSANTQSSLLLPPGQGRSTRGIRSVITGQKIRSHSHHSRRRNESVDQVIANITKQDHHLEQDHDDLENRSKTSSGKSNWKLVKSYSGNSFFDDMFFFSNADPTNGIVDYVDRKEAKANGLIGTKNGKVFIKMQKTSQGAPKSVRISTKDSFTTGIFILDAEHIPVGCGVWPAWWTTPQNPAGGWPNGGEIDIIEGVHHQSRNTYSIHTSSGCHMDRDKMRMAGKLSLPGNRGTNCASLETSNEGCGVKSDSEGDFGVDYNRNKGGVHAMYWDSNQGIKSFFFQRSQIPDDIRAGDPDPSKWGMPKASWPATKCNMDTFFWNHVVVFTNTLCGDWAGSGAVWSQPMNGQDQSCKAITNHASCSSYINSNPDLSQAYWTINSLKIYQTRRRH